MTKSGITRRIDELGRIVIPKEIRKSINIHNGEELEISVENNEIIIKKYNVMVEKMYFLNNLLTILEKYTNASVIITNLDNVLYATDELLVGKKLDNNLKKVISGEDVINTDKTTIIFEDITLNKYVFLNQVIIDSTCFGAIIIYSDEPINQTNKNYIKLCNEIIKSIYDIS